VGRSLAAPLGPSRPPHCSPTKRKWCRSGSDDGSCSGRGTCCDNGSIIMAAAIVTCACVGSRRRRLVPGPTATLPFRYATGRRRVVDVGTRVTRGLVAGTGIVLVGSFRTGCHRKTHTSTYTDNAVEITLYNQVNVCFIVTVFIIIGPRIILAGLKRYCFRILLSQVIESSTVFRLFLLCFQCRNKIIIVFRNNSFYNHGLSETINVIICFAYTSS